MYLHVSMYLDFNVFRFLCLFINRFISTYLDLDFLDFKMILEVSFCASPHWLLQDGTRRAQSLYFPSGPMEKKISHKEHYCQGV